MSDTLDRLEQDAKNTLNGTWTGWQAKVLSLVAVVRAVETYEEAVESGSAKEDGGIALQVTYRQLREALAALDQPAEMKPPGTPVSAPDARQPKRSGMSGDST